MFFILWKNKEWHHGDQGRNKSCTKKIKLQLKFSFFRLWNKSLRILTIYKTNCEYIRFWLQQSMIILMLLFRKEWRIFAGISYLTAVHYDTEASILEGVKDSD